MRLRCKGCGADRISPNKVFCDRCGDILHAEADRLEAVLHDKFGPGNHQAKADWLLEQIGPNGPFARGKWGKQ